MEREELAALIRAADRIEVRSDALGSVRISKAEAYWCVEHRTTTDPDWGLIDNDGQVLEANYNGSSKVLYID